MGTKIANENSWVQELKDLDIFLEKTFTNADHGEIWLYNDNLDAFSNEITFEKLYLELISKTFYDNIDAVKFILEDHYFDELLKNTRVIDNLNIILNRVSNARKRLNTFYFAKKSDFDTENEYLKNSTWVFYNHGKTINSNSGIVFYRPNVRNVAYRNAEYKKTFVSRLESFNLSDDLKETFNNLFYLPLNNNEDKFFYLDVDENENFVLIKGISSETNIRKKERSKKDSISISTFVNNKIDIAIISALAEEAIPLKRAIESNEEILIGGKQTSYKLDKDCYTIKTKKGNYQKILIAPCQFQGNLESALTTQEIILAYNPKILFLVGVCGAINTDSKQSIIGNILVPDHVRYYERGRLINFPIVENNAIKSESEIHISPHSYGSITIGNEFLAKLKEYIKISRGKYIVEDKVIEIKDEVTILSGEKLILDQNFVNFVSSDDNTVGVEMEGAGFAKACEKHNKDFAIIRSIMDECNHVSRPDKHTKRHNKKIASEVASKFLIDFIIDTF